MTGKCPYCGETVQCGPELTYRHYLDGVGGCKLCPGSRQIPRARTDNRPTWRDEKRSGIPTGEWEVLP